MHLFEFRAAKRKLTCLCGWEKTIKTADLKVARAVFEEHRDKESRPPGSRP